MSYTYLQGAGAEFSAECFSDIEPFVRLRLTPTVEKSSCNASETGSCLGSQFGMTSQHLTPLRGAESRRWFAEAFLAKTSAQPTQPQKESLANAADCGKKWPEWFARWDRDSSLWKTRQCSLVGDWELFSETWPNWGMMQDGASYPLPTLAPHISESEFGYLPTPDASLGMKAGMEAADFVSSFRKAAGETRPSGAAIGSSLRWHPEFIHEWQRTGGELNAQWTEALMGWPIDWTDLRPLETVKFQSWLQLHGDF